MMYRFRPLPELYFGILVAAGTVVLLELASLNPDGIADWKTWGVALAAGAIRAAAGAALDWIRRGIAGPDDDPLDRLKADILALSPADRAILAADIEMHGRIEARVRQIPGGPPS